MNSRDGLNPSDLALGKSAGSLTHDPPSMGPQDNAPWAVFAPLSRMRAPRPADTQASLLLSEPGTDALPADVNVNGSQPHAGEPLGIDLAELEAAVPTTPGIARLAPMQQPISAAPVTDALGRPVGERPQAHVTHTFVLHWHTDTLRLEDGTLVHRVIGADFVSTDVCFFCRTEAQARTLLSLVQGAGATHTVIKTTLQR